MNNPSTTQIVEVELFHNGAKITFGDGSCAVYPATLLFACRNLATIMSELQCEEPLVSNRSNLGLNGVGH